MNLYRKFEYWMYLGIGRDAIDKYAGNIAADNLIIMKNECLILSILVLFVAAVLYPLESTPVISKLCLMLSAAGIILFFSIRHILKPGLLPTKGTANALIFIFSLCGYAIGIYIGAFLDGGDVAVTVIWLFLFMQVNFDLPPVQNLLSVLAFSIIFMTCSFFFKQYDKAIYDAVDTAIAVAVGIILSWHKSKIKWENVMANEKLRETNLTLYRTSTTDTLTGLPNRGHTFALLTDLKEKCDRDGSRFVCLVIDVDNFKYFNDTYGHPAGDRMLEKIGLSFRGFAEENGIVIGRIGGEEFAAFWEESESGRETAIAEQIRLAVSNIACELSDCVKKLTVSIGIFVGRHSLDALFAYSTADRAMYKAKENGKNCCYIYCPETDTILPVKK